MFVAAYTVRPEQIHVLHTEQHTPKAASDDEVTDRERVSATRNLHVKQLRGPAQCLTSSQGWLNFELLKRKSLWRKFKKKSH